MTSPQSFNSIIETAFRTNNESYIQRCYNENFVKVKAYVLRNNGSEQDAKDVYQEAFLVLWDKTSKGDTQFESDSQVSAFLYIVAKNKWLDQLGSARVRKKSDLEVMSLGSVIPEESEIDEESQYTEKLNQLKLAFSKLGDNCKKILSMFYYEKKSMLDIGSHMNLDSASARNQKYRCMKKLKELTKK